jgi:outer membrane protein OmpA-like peptidoglycan-associated protein
MGHTVAAPDVDTSVVAPPSLTPPAEYRRRQAALGFQSLAALDPVESRSTIEAGRVKFGEGTFEMVAGQSAVLNDVVRLYHEKGGRIRIIGHSVSGRLDVNAKANREANASLARGRAEAVARELIRLGIPGRSIYAGATAADLAVNGPVDLADEEANIFIDY